MQLSKVLFVIFLLWSESLSCDQPVDKHFNVYSHINFHARQENQQYVYGK